MLIVFRQALVASLLVGLTACSGSNAGGMMAPQGAIGAAAQSPNGVVIFRKISMHPNAGTPVILMNFLANGPNQAGVPCIDCVNGASTSDNVGLTGPSNYVASNFVWQYGTSFTDISYKGKCKLSWDITSGKKTIDTFSKTIDLATAGGFVLYAIARPRPKYSGPATETGKVTCGKTSQSLKVPLQFE